MRRLVVTLVIAIMSFVSLTGAARAGSVWDPDEPGRRLDLRWVGVYPLDDGRMRVTVTFHHAIKLRWFGSSGVDVAFTHDDDVPPYWFFTFRRNGDRLRARLCEGGSGCAPGVAVLRPDRRMIRAWLEPLYAGQPADGWRFRGRSFRDGPGTLLDRTGRGTV